MDQYKRFDYIVQVIRGMTNDSYPSIPQQMSLLSKLNIEHF